MYLGIELVCNTDDIRCLHVHVSNVQQKQPPNYLKECLVAILNSSDLHIQTMLQDILKAINLCSVVLVKIEKSPYQNMLILARAVIGQNRRHCVQKHACEGVQMRCIARWQESSTVRCSPRHSLQPMPAGGVASLLQKTVQEMSPRYAPAATGWT